MAIARLVVPAVLALVAAECLLAQTAFAAPDDPDYDVPRGHFFTEAVTNEKQAGLGFAVLDGGGVDMWTAYQGAGGVWTLGYPVSRRFELNGGQDVAQIFSESVLVWTRSNAETAAVPLASIDSAQIPGYARDPEKPPMAAAGIDPFPWSGWWWPASPGIGPTLFAPNGPLDKYDQYVAAIGDEDPATRDWERSNVYFPGISWAGHCNGYAAAALLESEPTSDVELEGITFTVADLKGLLADYHFGDTAAWSFGDGTVSPADFHRQLLDWVERENKGFVVSFDMGGGETWSYPLGRFESAWAPDAVENGLWHVTTTVWLADMNVPADFVGTRLYPNEAGKTFTYDVYGDPRHPSDGVWTGASASGRFAHPGRIWYPKPGTPAPGARELVSPGLNHNTLQRILAAVTPVG